MKLKYKNLTKTGRLILQRIFYHTCYLCGEVIEKSSRLYADHNHSTGYVRGMICPTCNLLCGHVDNGFHYLALNIIKKKNICVEKLLDYVDSPMELDMEEYEFKCLIYTFEELMRQHTAHYRYKSEITQRQLREYQQMVLDCMDELQYISPGNRKL